MAVDGLLLRWPVIGQPLFLPPRTRESTRGPVPHQGFPKATPTYERRLWGSGNFDEIQDQRFTRGPARLAAPGRSPIRSCGGFGVTIPVYTEPVLGVRTAGVRSGDYGNLPPKTPIMTFQTEIQQKTSRTPVKTY